MWVFSSHRLLVREIYMSTATTVPVVSTATSDRQSFFQRLSEEAELLMSQHPVPDSHRKTVARFLVALKLAHFQEKGDSSSHFDQAVRDLWEAGPRIYVRVSKLPDSPRFQIEIRPNKKNSRWYAIEFLDDEMLRCLARYLGSSKQNLPLGAKKKRTSGPRRGSVSPISEFIELHSTSVG